MFEQMSKTCAGEMIAEVSFIFVLLQLCSGSDITCSGTQDHNQTTYSITDVDHILDSKATNCEYMLINDENVTIAHHWEKIASVEAHSLVTPGCWEKTVFKRNCVSERVEHTADCTTICSDSALSKGNKETVSWIPILVIMLLAVAVAASVVLCWKFKDKLHRIRYIGVKKSDTEEATV